MNDRQAGPLNIGDLSAERIARAFGHEVEFGVSFASALIGDELLTKHIADPEFMKQENWAAELASRVCRAMVVQAVSEEYNTEITEDNCIR